jgi:ABC-type multidrug transport system ATPase subunit
MTLLLGGPGSGKSTLMKVLSGRLKGKNFTVGWHFQHLGCLAHFQHLGCLAQSLH